MSGSVANWWLVSSFYVVVPVASSTAVRVKLGITVGFHTFIGIRSDRCDRFAALVPFTRRIVPMSVAFNFSML